MRIHAFSHGSVKQKICAVAFMFNHIVYNYIILQQELNVCVSLYCFCHQNKKSSIKRPQKISNPPHHKRFLCLFIHLFTLLCVRPKFVDEIKYFCGVVHSHIRKIELLLV